MLPASPLFPFKMALSTSSLMLSALAIRDWLVSLLSALLLLLVVFWSSAFLYGSFYLAYMPSDQTREIPAHFTFKVCQDLRSRCSFPSAKVRQSSVLWAEIRHG